MTKSFRTGRRLNGLRVHSSRSLAMFVSGYTSNDYVQISKISSAYKSQPGVGNDGLLGFSSGFAYEHLWQLRVRICGSCTESIDCECR